MIKRIKHIVFVVFMGVSLTGFTQNDSLAQAYAAQKNKKALQDEQNELNFQQFFFEALTQKAIGNYDKAITALENCQNIHADDVAVNFELSKNYLAQEKYFEAEAFVQKALKETPEDLFLLEHLKTIYIQEKKYKEALGIQEKIVSKKPSTQPDLIILYIRNNRIEDARNLLIELEKNGVLSERLTPFKESLFSTSELESLETDAPIEEKGLLELKTIYATTKTVAVLTQLLIKQYEEKEYLALEKVGAEGLALFPAQPMVYLMYAKGLNKLKKYGDALTALQSGLDYIVDDYVIEADFYEQISLSYKGLGKNVEATKYYNLALEMRQKKSQ
tara:strand:- start:224545 stop:225540 length:996 start_codon:yes stop_codon:yes gene_type:complete